jgi:hypothetical protein
MPRTVRLADLTPEQRAVVLALIAAKKSAEERKPQPITDPVALRKLASLIAPALVRVERKQAPTRKPERPSKPRSDE